MADIHGVAITEVKLRRHLIVVEAEQYTFTFVRDQRKTTTILRMVDGIDNGKRHRSFDFRDQYARYVERVARQFASEQLRLWEGQNPSFDLTSLNNETIWLDPSYARLTPEQCAANRAAIDQLLAGLAQQLRMPGT